MDSLAGEPPAPDNADRAGGARPARILVVEDEPHILHLVQRNLEREGYAVETAVNGVDALGKILARTPDLLISDVMMPEMDGFELLEHLRGDPDLADLPVLLLTVRSRDPDVQAGYRRGADLYLTKPFHPDELLAFVRRLLRAERTPGDAL
jgi:DNA-binding response OmpR family regulator